MSRTCHCGQAVAASHDAAGRASAKNARPLAEPPVAGCLWPRSWWRPTLTWLPPDQRADGRLAGRCGVRGRSASLRPTYDPPVAASISCDVTHHGATPRATARSHPGHTSPAGGQGSRPALTRASYLNWSRTSRWVVPDCQTMVVPSAHDYQFVTARARRQPPRSVSLRTSVQIADDSAPAIAPPRRRHGTQVAGVHNGQSPPESRTSVNHTPYPSWSQPSSRAAHRRRPAVSANRWCPTRPEVVADGSQRRAAQAR